VQRIRPEQAREATAESGARGTTSKASAEEPLEVLTEAQREIRRTGIGASEVAQIVDVHPYQGPMHVWLRKPTPTRGPLIPDDDPEDALSATSVGSILEEGMRQLFSKKTGIALARPGPITLRHERFPAVLASPDDLAANENSGLEIKIVGANNAHTWREGLPDHHELQARQNMAVTNRERWFVIALLGGIDVRLHCVERDLAVEDMLLDAADTFWNVHVLGDEPPDPRDEDERREYLARRYSAGSSKEVIEAFGDADLLSCMRNIRDAKQAIAEAEAVIARAENTMLERLGGGYGLQTEEGKFIWFSQRANPNWKAIAEELAGGVVPSALIEKHRGPAFSVARFYPRKK
jgi:putative phage-type endonuclease